MSVRCARTNKLSFHILPSLTLFEFENHFTFGPSKVLSPCGYHFPIYNLSTKVNELTIKPVYVYTKQNICKVVSIETISQ